MLFMGVVLLDVGHSEFGVAAFGFGRVAQHRGPSAEVDLRGFQLDVDVLVAQHVPQDAVGLPPGFAEHGAVGGAQEFIPALLLLQGEAAQFGGGHVELQGGGIPSVPVGAVLGGFEQRVVEDGLGGDHGEALMVEKRIAYECTIGYTLSFREVKPNGIFCSVFIRAVGVSPPRQRIEMRFTTRAVGVSPPSVGTARRLASSEG